MAEYQDLLKDTSVLVDNGNYFVITVTDLDVNTLYPLQFRWKYSDGTFGPWSAGTLLNTPGASTPGTPSALVVTGGAGYLFVSWDGKDSLGNTMTDITRLDIYVDGSPFDGTKPSEALLTAGSKSIPAPAGTYIVTAFAVSTSGTKSAFNTPVTAVVTAAVKPADPSVTPNTPTVSSVLGAIQVAWNGKTSTGADQPYGFNAAKIYIGTSENFTPSSSNQVEKLNFANGQNVVNIGVGTVVAGVALDYGIDYYIKIATTNGTDLSSFVAATGNPVQIGQVKSGDITAIAADKITTGTLQSNSTITVGATSGKHIKLAGTGDPLTIYGSGGTSNPILSFNGSKLSIVGDGTFSGNLSIGSDNTIFKAEPATGIWLGNATYSSAPFSVSNNGVIKASSGTIGGWTLGGSYLQGTNFQLNSTDSTMYVGPYSSGNHIRVSANYGIVHTAANGVPTGKFTLSPNGNLTVSGDIVAGTFSAKGQYTSYNYWDEDEFNAGTQAAYIRSSTADNSVVIAALATTDNSAGTGSSSDLEADPEGYTSGSKIVVDGTNGVQIYNIPALKNGLTYAGYIDPIGTDTYVTMYNNPSTDWYNRTKGYGSAARIRTVVYDVYSGMLKRGMAVYYGQRTNAPGTTTGYVGDLWVSWA